jgi:hypothetical protein
VIRPDTSQKVIPAGRVRQIFLIGDRQVRQRGDERLRKESAADVCRVSSVNRHAVDTAARRPGLEDIA